MVGFDCGDVKLLSNKTDNSNNLKFKVLNYPSPTIASLSFTNTIIAGLMALKAFQVITQLEAFSEKNINIDFKTMKIYNIN